MFNVGDRVRCTHTLGYEEHLVHGTIYTISRVRELRAWDNGVPLIELEGHDERGYRQFRFQLVQEANPQPVEEPEEDNKETHTFYVVLYKSERNGEILRQSHDTLERANRLVQSIDENANYTLLTKKKITIRY